MLNIWALRNVLQNPDFEEVWALAFQKGLDFAKYFGNSIFYTPLAKLLARFVISLIIESAFSKML